MKQSDLKVNKTVFVKKSHVSPWLRRGQAFTIRRIIQGEKGVNRYYNEVGQMAKANELTEVPCSEKECPCHGVSQLRTLDLFSGDAVEDEISRVEIEICEEEI